QPPAARQLRAGRQEAQRPPGLHRPPLARRPPRRTQEPRRGPRRRISAVAGQATLPPLYLPSLRSGEIKLSPSLLRGTVRACLSAQRDARPERGERSDCERGGGSPAIGC